ncbi:MAG: hypothetical protein ACRDH1_08315 [Actinomycetota bacterium]
MQPEIVALIALALIIGAAVVFVIVARRRRQGLQERFGSEYDRTVDHAESRRRAESELADRVRRVGRLELRPLDPDRRDEYARQWRDAQAHFVDAPGEAVQEADRVVAEVMAERGYPVEDFEQREADLSVHHSGVIEHYRAGHGITLAYRQGHAGTEDLRQAMVHYRALFEDLLEGQPSEEPEVVVDVSDDAMERDRIRREP